jgi:hypothetical protein
MKSFIIAQLEKIKPLLPTVLQGACAGLNFWFGSISVCFFYNQEEGYGVEVEDKLERLFDAEERVLYDLIVALDAYFATTSDLDYHDEDTCSF